MDKSRSRRALILIAVICVLSLQGCKSANSVEMRMVLPPGAQAMEVPMDQTFLMATPIIEPLPAYPVGASRDINVSSCVEIVIAVDGSVSLVTPLYALPECPLTEDEIDPAFIASVTSSVKQWQYFAAAVCTFPQGVPKNDDCLGDGVVITPTAIKLSYVFTFQSGGRVSVKPKHD